MSPFCRNNQSLIALIIMDGEVGLSRAILRLKERGDGSSQLSSAQSVTRPEQASGIVCVVVVYVRQNRNALPPPPVLTLSVTHVCLYAEQTTTKATHQKATFITTLTITATIFQSNHGGVYTTTTAAKTAVNSSY